MTAALAALALALAPAAAPAVTVGYTDAPGAGLAVSGAPGEASDVAVALDCGAQGCTFTVVQRLTVLATAGPGCNLAGVQPATVVCDIGRGARVVRASLGDEDDTLRITACGEPLQVVADLGTGNDRFTGCAAASGTAASADDVAGGPGADVLAGRAGDDRLDGGPGDDTIDGGAGHDLLLGRPGLDRLRARDGERDGLSCGTDPGGTATAGGVAVLDAIGSLDDALVDTADGFPADCERITSARTEERTGVWVKPLGVARPDRNNLVVVRMGCRLATCRGLVRVDLVRHGAPVTVGRSGRETTFNLQRGVTLRAPITLSRGDVARLRRAGDRVVAMRVAVLEPGRRGWRTTVVTVPVRR